jgi:hypothetical protein
MKPVRVSGSQVSRQSAYESGKVVSPTHRPPLTQRNILDTHSCYRLRRPKGRSVVGSITSMTPSGLEPVIFKFVAQCLNQLRHRVPPLI